MKIKISNKIVLISVMTILMIFIINLFNYSNASSIGFISFNNAPRKYFEVSDSKLADVTMRIEDNNGISSVELYTVDTNGNNPKKINFSTANTSDSTKHIYTLSNKNLLKGKTKCFYIKIKDKTGNIHYSGFRVCAKSKKVNKKTVKYYSIDDSPRVKEWIASGNNASFIVRDLGGTKYAKVQDANNGNKEIYKFEDLAKGDARVTIDMTKFKASDGIYKLRIVTEDHNKQQSIKKVRFKQNVSVIKRIKSDITSTNKTQTIKNDIVTTNKTQTIKNDIVTTNKTLKILFVGNSKTYVNDIPAKFQGLAKAGGYKVSVTSATEGGKTLKYLASKYKSKINKSYDIVILQEQTDAYKSEYETFLSGAKSISKMVKDKNTNVKIFVRQTWVKKDSSSSVINKAYKNAENVAKNIGASLIYDGKAMYKLNSGSLFKDNTHQSAKGAYLSACSIYNAVFERSPVGLSYKAGLSDSTVKKLQKTANDVYQSETK